MKSQYLLLILTFTVTFLWIYSRSLPFSIALNYKHREEFRKNGRNLSNTSTTEYEKCLQKEWYESENINSTSDLGTRYQISYSDVQRTFRWVYLPKINAAEIIFTIMTRVDGLARRNVIRRTWMTQKNRIKSVFVIGLGGIDDKTKEVVMREAELHGDIVVTDLEDHYSTVSFKTPSMLLYALSKVPSAKFIGKIDDDMLFFPNTLLSYMDNNSTIFNENQSAMFGRIKDGPAVEAGLPIGAECCKSFDSNHTCTNHVTYLGGPFFLMTRKAAEDVLLATKHRKFHKIDDAMFTGYLADDVGATRHNLPIIHMRYENQGSVLFSSHLTLQDHEYTREYWKTMRYFKNKGLFNKYIK